VTPRPDKFIHGVVRKACTAIIIWAFTYIDNLHHNILRAQPTVGSSILSSSWAIQCSKKKVEQYTHTDIQTYTSSVLKKVVSKYLRQNATVILYSHRSKHANSLYIVWCDNQCFETVREEQKLQHYVSCSIFIYNIRIKIRSIKVQRIMYNQRTLVGFAMKLSNRMFVYST
jgi:hypothetical protein